MKSTSCLLVALAACTSTPEETGKRLSAAACPPVSTMFENAVCVCEDLTHLGNLHVDSGPAGSGSVGVNGKTTMTTIARVSGTWRNGGDFEAVGAVVGDSLVTPGNVTLTGYAEIDGDATIGGDLTCTGAVAIGGTLALGGQSRIDGTETIGSRAPYVAPAAPPCDCDPATFFDVEAAVADARAAAGGVPSFTLENGTQRRLASGNYYLTSSAITGNASIVIEGEVSVFVDGSLALVGNESWQIAPGGKLDLFVSGDVSNVGNMYLGSPVPGSFRLYIGGSGTTEVGIVGNTEIDGTLYAPRATIDYVGNARVIGGVFAKTIVSTGNVQVLYGSSSTPPTSCPGGGGGGSNDDGDGPVIL